MNEEEQPVVCKELLGCPGYARKQTTTAFFSCWFLTTEIVTSMRWVGDIPDSRNIACTWPILICYLHGQGQNRDCTSFGIRLPFVLNRLLCQWLKLPPESVAPLCLRPYAINQVCWDPCHYAEFKIWQPLHDCNLPQYKFPLLIGLWDDCFRRATAVITDFIFLKLDNGPAPSQISLRLKESTSHSFLTLSDSCFLDESPDEILYAYRWTYAGPMEACNVKKYLKKIHKWSKDLSDAIPPPYGSIVNALLSVVTVGRQHFFVLIQP